MKRMTKTAGGVVTRTRKGTRQVLVVRRRRQGDWVLPKGRCHRNERWIHAALREVSEETGRCCDTKRHLGKVVVDGPRGKRAYRFWLMEQTGRCQRHIAEISDVKWMVLPDARKKLSSPIDLLALRWFERVTS